MSNGVERVRQMDKFSEKDVYREKIIEFINKIHEEQVLRYIYIIVRDIVNENK